MAGGSLFMLLDDIASVLDDVAAMTKVAAKKTAGVLGDDLALNAQQVSGVRANRELPVVGKVALGSLVNKAVLVPAALLISAFLPWAVTPLMMIGGAYLCFEGVEKLAHRFLHPADAAAAGDADAPSVADVSDAGIAAMENSKVRGAIRTDFILSAEIIVLALGVVALQPLMQQVLVLVVVALAMTVGVYGLVAGIVKLDDVGFWLSRKGGTIAAVGRGLVALAPWLMKSLSVIGTAAMFLVGGGILVHAVPALHHFVLALAPTGVAATLVGLLANLVVGIVVGAAVLAVVQLVGRLRGVRAHG